MFSLTSLYTVLFGARFPLQAVSSNGAYIKLQSMSSVHRLDQHILFCHARWDYIGHISNHRSYWCITIFLILYLQWLLVLYPTWFLLMYPSWFLVLYLPWYLVLYPPWFLVLFYTLTLDTNQSPSPRTDDRKRKRGEDKHDKSAWCDRGVDIELRIGLKYIVQIAKTYQVELEDRWSFREQCFSWSVRY